MERREDGVFQRELAGIGRLRLRPLRLHDDIVVVHSWVTREHAKHWGMLGQSLEQVARAYAAIQGHAEVYMGLCNDEPAFLLESYAPEREPVGQHYAVSAGDRGMHVLVAPPRVPVHGFTWAVFRTVMDFLFSDPSTQRIVVEPDVQNEKIHTLNRRAGFRYQELIELPNKTAHLAFCTRDRYTAALDQLAGKAEAGSDDPLSHLDRETWSHVNRALVCKAISELSHELLLTPRCLDGAGRMARWVVEGGTPGVEYRFQGRVLELDHWDIDLTSLEKVTPAGSVPIDALDFIVELREPLGLSAEVLPVYLEEIASTLYAAAYKRRHQRWTSSDLLHAGFQELEAAMVQGHPSFVANSGRIGFDCADYREYAPEAGAAVRLVWVAASRRHAEFTCSRDLSYRALIAEELGPLASGAFDRRLRESGLAPDDYVFIPVHPWQWFNRLALTFAGEIARRDLVYLGHGDDEYGGDEYQAQQSIRTFFNLTSPHKRYVKTALSVLNMGFMRGLSADYMRDTPPINDWVAELIQEDGYFAAHGFGMLREVAAVGYRNPHFESALPKGSPYRKMLAALWRESPVGSLKPGERLMTMAALLHRDRDDVPLLPRLIRASGIGTDEWLDRFLDCYLAPLVHCFYRYDLAFMPHGENIILVLDGHAPSRAILKDVAEEAVVMDGERPLPGAVQRLRASVPEDIKLLAIFTDVFDGILRYLAQILLESGYTEERFWRRVARSASEYRRSQPELRDKLDRYDLFAPEFPRSCLNRLQLANNQQMIDLADPAKNLRFAGTLKNPIAAWRDLA